MAFALAFGSALPAFAIDDDAAPTSPALTTQNGCGLVFDTDAGQMYAFPWVDDSGGYCGSSYDALEPVDSNSFGWGWDAETSTLSLTDFNWVASAKSEHPGLQFRGSLTDVLVNVAGRNLIESWVNAALVLDINVTFTGSGHLDLIGIAGVEASGSSIVFYTGTFDVIGYGGTALSVSDGYVQVTDAVVWLEAGSYPNPPAVLLENSSLTLLGGETWARYTGGFVLEGSQLYVRGGKLDILAWPSALTLRNYSSVKVQGGDVEIQGIPVAIDASDDSEFTVELPSYSWRFAANSQGFGPFNSADVAFNFPTYPPANATSFYIRASKCGLLFDGAVVDGVEGRLLTRVPGDRCEGAYSWAVPSSLWNFDPDTYTLTLTDLNWSVTGNDIAGLQFSNLEQPLNLAGAGTGNLIASHGETNVGLRVDPGQTINFSGGLEVDVTSGSIGLQVRGHAIFDDENGTFSFTAPDNGISAVDGGKVTLAASTVSATGSDDGLSFGLTIASGATMTGGALNATGTTAGIRLAGSSLGYGAASFSGGAVTALGATGIVIYDNSQLTVDGAEVTAAGAYRGVNIANEGGLAEFKSGLLRAQADTSEGYAIVGNGTFAAPATDQPYFWRADFRDGTSASALVGSVPVHSGPEFAKSTDHYEVELRSATPSEVVNWHLFAIDLAEIDTRCVIAESLEAALTALNWYVFDLGNGYDALDTGGMKRLGDAFDNLAALNHTDGDVTIEPLPWQYCVDASPVPNTDAKHIALTAGVGAEQQVLSLHDISLRDILNGEAGVVQPPSPVTVTVGGLPLAGATSVQVAYIDPADQVEYLEAAVAGGLVTFTTDHFSHYGVTAAATQADPIDDDDASGDAANDHDDDSTNQGRDGDQGREGGAGGTNNNDANNVNASSTRNVDTSRTRLLATGMATLPLAAAAALLALGKRLRKK